MNNPDGVARQCRLPNDEFMAAWTSIKLAEGVGKRLLAQSLLSLTVRQKLPFESAPLHGLILLISSFRSQHGSKGTPLVECGC
jgi:hypothetical protein